MLRTGVNITGTKMYPRFNMHLIINKYVTFLIFQNLFLHYMRKSSSADIGIFYYIDEIFLLRNVLPNCAEVLLKHHVQQ